MLRRLSTADAYLQDVLNTVMITYPPGSRSPSFKSSVLQLQALHQLLPYERAQPEANTKHQHHILNILTQYTRNLQALPSNSPISPTVLISSMPIHKRPLPINLQTPKDILGRRYPSIVRRVPLVVDMYIPTPPRTPSTTLRTRPARSITPCTSPSAIPRPTSPVALLLWEESAAGT